MKVYDKNLSDIVASLPVPQKVVLAVGALFIIFALIYVPYILLTFGHAQKDPGPVTLSRLPGVVSILDPAMASADGLTLMAFTAVTKPESEAVDFGTEVHIANANKNCESFSDTSAVFETKSEELIGPDGLTPVTAGIWRTETPTIVHDPEDKGREWKIYAYKYFWAKNIPLARMYGFIVTKTASEPQGPWSQEEWIFSANQANPPYPYAPQIKSHLNALDPSLQNVYFYARPSAIQVNNVILMTLSAFVQGSDLPDRIILIASIDHGRSWKYLGTPLTSAMAKKIGPYTKLSGATLIEDKSTIYLAAVLGDDAVEALGTFLMPFNDVLNGSLRIDERTLAPVVFKTIPRISAQPTVTGGGFAAYSVACKAGIITSELSGMTGQYEIFKTYQTPASKK